MQASKIKTMKILVFVKQVPNTDDVKLDPKTGNICREGVESMLNPMDANAVEVALQLKEKFGGTVSAVSMGPPQAAYALKRVLGMGADEAYLLSDRAFGGADTLATSYTLAKAAEKIGGYDILLFGRLATDGDTAQTGPAVAAWLDVPQITLADTLCIEDGWVVCDRKIGSMRQRVKAKLPAAVAVTGDINKPRYPTPLNIMRASKKPFTTWTAADLECDVEKVGIPGSPSSTKTVFEPEKRTTDTKYFTGDMADIAAELVKALETEHLI